MDGIGWAAAAMSAARERLETAAGNLANASTDGFRAVRLRGALTTGGIAFQRLREESRIALRPTGRALDFAVAGGTFALVDAGGGVARSPGGSFVRDASGRVCDDRGRFIAGRHGALKFPEGAELETDGRVVLRGAMIDRVALPRGASIQSGFVPAANIDPIGQMVDMLAAQRSFETAEKAVTAIDQTRERAASQVALVRA